MKIYIATPVNGRKEATLIEKQEAAQKRCYYLRERLAGFYPDAKFWSSVTNIVVARKGMPDREAPIMGSCIREVLSADIVFFDRGWEESNGCQLEHYAACLYGKTIRYACELNIEPENAWQPCKSIDEAAAIVRANPITEEMTYDERLAAQKKRFGL